MDSTTQKFQLGFVFTSSQGHVSHLARWIILDWVEVKLSIRANAAAVETRTIHTYLFSITVGSSTCNLGYVFNVDDGTKQYISIFDHRGSLWVLVDLQSGLPVDKVTGGEIMCDIMEVPWICRHSLRVHCHSPIRQSKYSGRLKRVAQE